MPQDIFKDVTRPPAGLGSQAWYTVPASILTHAGIVAILVLIPLVATDVVPLHSPGIIAFAAPPMPPPPPPQSEPQRATAPSTQPAPSFDRTFAPTTAPDRIGDEVARPEGPPGLPTVETGLGSSAGIPGGTGPAVSVPAPPPPADVKPMRPGGQVKYPEKLRDVRPVYPSIAVASKIEGTVIIEAIIGIDGRVKDARILRSIPLLDRAALEAVNQWLFSPSLLNGVPVPVIITVTVNFKLQ